MLYTLVNGLIGLFGFVYEFELRRPFKFYGAVPGLVFYAGIGCTFPFSFGSSRRLPGY